MTKIINKTIMLLMLLSSFAYGLSTELISNNFVEHKDTLSLADFKHVKNHKGAVGKKAVYQSKETGKLWMFDKTFDAISFRQYVFGDLYRLVLGNRAPELRLIKNSKGKLMLGSEFIPEFKSLLDFFEIKEGEPNEEIIRKAQILKECFPVGCDSEKDVGSLQISGGEDVMALMLLLGDLDGNAANLGLVPNAENPRFYEVAKVDQEEVLCGFVSSITLRSLAKIVFGEGKSYFTEFDYEKFDLNKIADAFDAIGNISDAIWGGTLLARIKELSQENISEEIKGFIDNNTKASIDILNERKNRCKEFAISLRCEAAVRAGDFKAIEDLIEKGFDINKPVEYIHLDTSEENQIASLVKLWKEITLGNNEFVPYFLKYAKQNGPITILEMALRYNQIELVQQIASISNDNSIRKAIKVARKLKKLEFLPYLEKAKNEL